MRNGGDGAKNQNDALLPSILQNGLGLDISQILGPEIHRHISILLGNNISLLQNGCSTHFVGNWAYMSDFQLNGSAEFFKRPSKLLGFRRTISVLTHIPHNWQNYVGNKNNDKTNWGHQQKLIKFIGTI
jgi:hypothetical protein